MTKQLNNEHDSVQYHQSMKKQVAVVLECWKAYIAQDLKEKERFLSKDATGGYIRRAGGAKELFDVSMEYFRHPIFLSHKSTQSQRFLAESRELLRCCSDMVEEFSRTLTAEAGTDFIKRMLCSSNRWTVRYRYYPPGVVLQNSEPHVAHCVATIYLYESDPALEYYDGRSWKKFNFSETTRPCFTGTEVEELSHGKLEALKHRVMSTPESIEKGRYSIALFVLPSDEEIERPRSQGRLRAAMK